MQGSGKAALAMHYTCILYLLGGVYNLFFQALHIASKDNVVADSISRINSALFMQLTASVNKVPTPVPTVRMKAIYRIVPDWMSKFWREMLNSILAKV